MGGLTGGIAVAGQIVLATTFACAATAKLALREYPRILRVREAGRAATAARIILPAVEIAVAGASDAPSRRIGLGP